jgi:DNA-nicking Smr family endonuclease
VPEYINSEPEIASKVLSVTTPAEKDGGEGAILIKLKKL